MGDIREEITEALEQLKQQRDDLRLKLHLAKMEASDEWKEIEPKLARLEAKAKELGTATAESSKEVGAAAKLLAEEVRAAFRNIAHHL